jgi:hypothetical protein
MCHKLAAAAVALVLFSLRRAGEDGRRDSRRPRKDFGGKQVTHAWFSLILAGTWADHCAEIAIYLRLNGVLPSAAKMPESESMGRLLRKSGTLSTFSY